MLTSSRNWSSGSAVQLVPGSGAGEDTATLPAHSASSMAAGGSQRWPPNICVRPIRPPAALPEHRLGLGSHVAAVLEGLDILNRNRAADRALVSVVDRHRDVANADFPVDRDRLLQGDGRLDPWPQDPDLAECRALARPAEVERDRRPAVLGFDMNVGDPGGRLER